MELQFTLDAGIPVRQIFLLAIFHMPWEAFATTEPAKQRCKAGTARAESAC